jgi:RNA polymerase sigma factor (sigma-70 family)
MEFAVTNQERDAMVMAHAPRAEKYARRVARQWRHAGVDADDMAGEALQALVEAANTFDSSRASFWTYAYILVGQRVRNHLLHFRFATSQTKSTRVQSIARKVSRTAGYLASELGREPTREEIGARLGSSVARVEMAQKTLRRSDRHIAVGDDRSDKDGGQRGWVAVCDNPSPFESVSCAEEARIVKQAITNALEQMRPRHAEIIRRRFFYDDERPTLTTLAAEFGVSRERVRQIEANALQRIAAALRRDLGGIEA